MKKILALILALLMALSCCGAVAETATSIPFLGTGDMTVVSGAQVDEEALNALLPMLGVDENSAGLIKTLLPLLNNLTEQGVMAGGGFQYDMFLKDSPLATIAVEQNENGIALATDLLPSYVISITPEDIQSLMGQVNTQAQTGDALGGVDVNELIMKLTMYSAQYSLAAASAVSMGEPEKGEFTFEGMDVTFNTKTQVNVDLEALKAAAEQLIAELKADESFQGFMSALGQSGLPMNALDTSIQLPEEFACFIYTNTDDDGLPIDIVTLVTMDVTAKGETVNVDMLVAGQSMIGNVYVPSQKLTVQVAVDTLDDGFQCSVDMYNGEQFVLGMDAVMAMGEETALSLSFYYMNPEKPLLTDTTVIAQGGERTYKVMDEGKTVLTLGQIMQDKEGQLVQALLGDFMSNGLGALLGRISSVMPEQASAIMGLLMPGQSAQ